MEKLSLQMHGNPETGWQEYKASRWIANFLTKGGFKVEMGVSGLPTAFRATYGKGIPAIAFLAEYDALPDIGHGCGHNIIGAAATGAGIAARPIVDEFGGTVVVMGCPAEELLDGKVIMIEKGAFDGLDVGLMIHPSSGGHNWVGFRTTASMSVQVEFWGREAHAAAAPWHGASALEALILAFNSINALRAHFRGSCRVNGIIADGGKVPNIIPDHSSAVFMLRAHEDAYLEELSGKVLSCFEGSARATGTQVNCQWGMRTKTMRLI